MIAFPVVWFIVNMFFCHIPSAASERGTTTFCVRFGSPSTMLNHTASIRFGRWIQHYFSGNIKPVPHFRANNCKTFAKKIIPGRSLPGAFTSRSSCIDPFRFAKKRCNTSQGFGALNSCVDWSEGFQIWYLEKINIYEHWTRATRFNSLWVSGNIYI